MPLVLRFAPDYMINVTEIADEKSDNPTINAIYEIRDFIEQIIAFIKELVNVFQNIKIDI